MSIRPVAARWFEILVLKKDRDKALECLAHTGAVQLQMRSEQVAGSAEIAAGESEYDRLAVRYQAWWPKPVAPPPSEIADPACHMELALSTLKTWAGQADETIDRLHTATRELEQLEALRSLLASRDADLPDLSRFLFAGPLLKGAMFRLPPAATAPDIAGNLATSLVADEEGDFLFVLGEPGAVASVEAELAAQSCRRMEIPAGLPHGRDAAVNWIESRLGDLKTLIERDETRLGVLSEAHGLALALGEIHRLRWLSDVVPDVGHTQRMAWITGWTADADGTRIERAMAGCDIHHFVAFPEPPPGIKPPVILRNPPWSRPFEALTRLLGMPAAGEADPSMLVSLIAPVLFGFMFGDIGQGFVLLVAGLVLRRRMPVLGVLVPGGAMAMVFGLLFGSVFTREDIAPALWIHPLQHPVTLLVVSVGAGAVILLLGLLLDALQTHWQGEARRWWRSGGGLLAAYCGLLITAFVNGYGLALVATGIIWFVLGEAVQGGWRKGLSAAGEMIEALLQIAVNTVSFARVGAFALAHAGLSVAVIDLADAAGAIGYLAGHRFRQRMHDRVGGAGGQHSDHASHAVRILHPVSPRWRTGVQAAPTATWHAQGPGKERAMTFSRTALIRILGAIAIGFAGATMLALAPQLAGAQEVTAGAAADPEVVKWALISAAGAAGLATLAAGYAVAMVGSSAVGAIAEKPELLGRVLILVGLAEGIAIYGLIVAMLILNRAG